MEIDSLEDFNLTDVKPPPKRFQPKPKNNVQSKKKVEPNKETAESIVKVKTENIESAEDSKKADSVVKVKTEKVEHVDSMNLDDDGLKMSAEDDDALFNVVEERGKPKDADMEEEDSCVREIDVYYNPTDDAQFYVVQFPLKPRWRPYEFDKCLKEIRLQPESTPTPKLEIDIQHDYASSTHRESHSRKQTLTSSILSSELASSTKLPLKVNHAIGVLKGNELYVCPVETILQLRPKIEVAEDGGDIVIEENVDRRGTKKLKDTVGKRPVSSSKDQDKTISSNTQNTANEEPWIPLKYRSSKSEASSISPVKLTSANLSDTPLIMRQREYLNSFFPKKENVNLSEKMESLRPLPFEERLKKWLCEGDSQAFKFSVLKYLDPEASAEDFIEVLEKYAVLVQGLWVPKSSIILPDCQATPMKALARDFVILKFSKKLKFSYGEIDAYDPTMRSLLNEALNGLGIDSEVLKSWKFKEPADPSFKKLYPSVAMEQEQVLEAHAPVILSAMKKRLLKKGGMMRGAGFPVEKQEALSKGLGVLFKTHGVHSLESICRGLRDAAMSASSLQNTVDKNWMNVAASCVNAPDELKVSIREFATVIHGLYVAKSSPTNPELNPLRDVVIQLLKNQPQNGKLKKSQIVKEAELSLKKQVSDNDFLKVMTELCDSSSNGWMLKNPH